MSIIIGNPWQLIFYSRTNNTEMVLQKCNFYAHSKWKMEILYPDHTHRKPGNTHFAVDSGKSQSTIIVQVFIPQVVLITGC